MTIAPPAFQSAPAWRHQSRSGGDGGGEKEAGFPGAPCELVPFPDARRLGWINKKPDVAGYKRNRKAAIKYLYLIENRTEYLRRLGVAEDRIDKGIAPVSRVLETWLASSVWQLLDMQRGNK